MEYARRLTRFDAVMVVIGGIIGGGIFLNPAVVAQRVHTSTFILLTWAVGGVIAVAGALSFAELGARRPYAGGGYVYLREAFGPLPAFLYGWTFLLVVNTGGMAAVAVTFARYATDLAHAPAAAVTPVAVAAIAILSVVNYFGIRPGAVTQNIFTVVKLGALVLLIGIGTLFPIAPAMAHAVSTVPTVVANGEVLKVLGVALIPVLFTYGGWAHTNNVAGEIIEPERNLPRAMVIGILVVVAVYLLANVAYLRTLGPIGLAGSTAPASDTMRATLGAAGGTLIGVGIAASTFGFVNLAVISAPRILQTMAADGLFFHRAARLHPRYRTPHVALLTQAAWGILLTLSGTYGQLLDYTVFGDWLFFAAITATLFVYRRHDSPANQPPWRAPGYPIVPAAFIVIALAVVASTMLSAPRNAGLGLLIVATGVPVFYAWRATVKGRSGRN